MMIVSVIVALYNKENWIGRAIESVINQTYSNWELIIVDDGSTDKSGIIAEEYANIDKRIKVFHRSNHGIADTRYYGYMQTTGDWITVLDADDEWDPDFLKLLLDNINDSHTAIAKLVYFDNDSADLSKNEIGENDIFFINREALNSEAVVKNIPVNLYQLVGRLTQRSTIEKALQECLQHRDEIPSNFFEDVILAPYINIMSEKICIIDYPLYRVRIINDSHSRSKNLGQSQYEQIIAAKIVLDYYQNHNFIVLFNNILPAFYLSMLKVLYYISKEKVLNEIQIKYKEMIEVFFEYYYKYYKACSMGFMNRMCVNLYRHNKLIWKMMMNLYFGSLYTKVFLKIKNGFDTKKS